MQFWDKKDNKIAELDFNPKIYFELEINRLTHNTNINRVCEIFIKIQKTIEACI